MFYGVGHPARWQSAIILAVVIALGLLTRSHWVDPHSVIGRYGGDTLWAVAAYWGIAFLLPGLSVARTALFSLLFAYLIETSQLFKAPWLKALRATLPGKLILGQGFLWSDILCYTVGVGMAILSTLIVARIKKFF